MKIKFLTIFILGLFLFFAKSNTTLALDNSNSASSSAQLEKVDHIANIRERLIERINLLFKFSSKDKANYQFYLANKRLAELTYIIDSKQGDYIEETSNRYSAYLGRLTNYITDNKLSDYKQELLDTYTSHQVILNQLVTNIEVDTGFWLLLQHNLNTNKILQEKVLHELKTS